MIIINCFLKQILVKNRRDRFAHKGSVPLCFWGKQTVTKNTIGFHRGYTGHEMMSEFGLINMNGRLYDPVIGRFLSPDNYVQLPDFSWVIGTGT